MKRTDDGRLQRFLDRPQRALWSMAGPMMAGLTLHTLYGLVDLFFVGRLGPEAVAGLTFVGPLFFTMFALAAGLSTGVTAVVAQAVGRRDPESGRRAALSALALAAVLTVVFIVAGQLMGRDLLRLLGAQGRTAALAWEYLQVLALGFPLVFVSSCLRGVLVGEGDTRTPMLVLGGATLMNTVLDPLLIETAGLGMRGAAVATVVAQLSALATYAVLLLAGRRFRVRLRGSGGWLDFQLLRRVLAIGLPTAVTHLVMAAGGALRNRVVAHFGDLAVAGYGAASRLDMVVALPVLGLAGAALSLAGMFAGAGRPDLIRSLTRYTLSWAALIAATLGLGAYLGSGWILRLFIDEPEALSVGAGYLAYMVFAYPLMGVGMTMVRVMQGLGHGLPALVVNLLRVLVLSIPLAYVAVFVFDAPLHVVWAMALLGGVCSDVVAFLWLRRVVWARDPTERAQAQAQAQAES